MEIYLALLAGELGAQHAVKLLAAIGVMSFLVTQGTADIAFRVALAQTHPPWRFTKTLLGEDGSSQSSVAARVLSW
jgi:hypothetical protein